MKTKLFVAAITLSLLLSGMLVAVGAEARAIDGEESVGEDTEEDEIQNAQEIHDWHDLDEIRNDLDGHYVLMGDLDENTEGYGELVDTEDGWDPIGGGDLQFGGSFDGNGHEISDLYIDRPEKRYIGLFGRLSDWVEVKDVGIIDADVRGENFVGGLGGRTPIGWVENSYVTGKVSGENFVGGLVGFNGGTVENSYATGEVSGESEVGGLVGGNYEGMVKDSHSTVDVSGGSSVGGLVGRNSEGTVSDSYATGEVNGEDIGGLVGRNTRARVQNSYATGEVSGKGHAGGLVGRNSGTVLNSYATGEVNGEGHAGGLVGYNTDTVSNSYAAGTVSGEGRIGGLVGWDMRDTVENSFWDTEASGMDESNGGTGKNTTEMKDVATYTDLDTGGLEKPWDFVGDPHDDRGDEDLWNIDEDENINEGYPFFVWDYDYTLSVDYIIGEGTVEVDGEEVTETPFEKDYKRGEEADLLADPAGGWYFKDWIGIGESGADITLTMDEDKEITAVFEEEGAEEYELTIDIEGEGGTDPPEGNHTYEEGEEVTVTAAPAEDWYFDEWTGDVPEGEGGEEITITMDGDKEITAVFKEEIDGVEKYNLTVNVDGEGTVEVEGEKVEDGWTGTYEDDTDVGLGAIPAENWKFVEWDGTDETGGSITVTMEEDKEITALFEEEVTEEYSLTIHIEGEGTVHRDFDPEPIAVAVNHHLTLYELEPETEVTLEIDEDYKENFEKWSLPEELSDDIEENDDKITFMIEDDYDITANFEEDIIDRIRDIPGFTSILLLLVFIISVVIHKRKERWS